MHGDAKGYHSRGTAYTQKKEYDVGIADLSKAIELDPNNLKFYHRRAWAYYVSGNAVYGLADIDRIIASKPKEAEFHEVRGLLLEDIGRRAEQLRVFVQH
jgi:tetratricopeptide (TPR) repeat protein